MSSKKKHPTEQNAEIVELTPEKAQLMLTMSDINYRLLNDARVDAIAEDIRTGRWELNGETIKLNKKGEVIDGQHRLWAIVTAGKNVKTWIVDNVDSRETVVSTIDAGRPRNFGDVLRNRGIANSTAAAAAIRYLYLYDEGKIKQNHPVTQRKLLQLWKDSGEAVSESLHATAHVRRLRMIPASRVAALDVVFRRFDADAAEQFWIDLVNGNALEPRHPVRVLYGRLYDSITRSDRRMKDEKKMALTILAWNRARTKGSLKSITLRWEHGNDFPKAV